MTDRELMQQALEALDCIYSPLHEREINKVAAAMTALRERLAERIDLVRYEYKPVAWISEGGDVSRSKRYMDEIGFECNPLYAAPQRREWVGLTADEIWKCNAAPKGSAVEYHICMAHQNVLDFAEAIEAKLKEKNT